MNKEKVFCSECKNFSWHKEEVLYCKAWEKGKWKKQEDTPFEKGYKYKDEWREKEMLELNKNNNCPYYEKNI